MKAMTTSRGVLAAIPDAQAESGKAYWLAYRSELARRPTITAFRDWLFDAMPAPGAG